VREVDRGTLDMTSLEDSTMGGENDFAESAVMEAAG
jgi:hypothetical protein